MFNKLQSMKHYYLLRHYSLPVIINIIAIYFWYSGNLHDSAGTAIFSLVFNAFFAPIYLAVCNSNIDGISLSRKAGYSFLSISACALIHYISWGIATGNVLSPDFKTEAIMHGEFLVACAIISIGLIAQAVSKSRRKREEDNNREM